MMLLTKELINQLPKLYSCEEIKDPTVVCKFFTPWAHWSWYAIEFDGDDLFFGYVAGHFPELGYFRLSELKAIKGPVGLKIERDLYFEPQPLSKIKSLHE